MCTSTSVTQVDGPLHAPVGSAATTTIRVENPTPLPTLLRDVVLEGDADFQLAGPVATQLVSAGTCAAPTSIEVPVVFTPERVRTRTAMLRGVLGEQPFAVALAGVGTGRSLEVPAVVTFGTMAAGTSARRDLVLRNLGTLGSEFEVVIESVRGMNADTDDAELCLGELTERCLRPSRIGVVGMTRLPLHLSARRPGNKAWEVTLRSNQFGPMRHVVPVVAFVVDTSGCRPRATVAEVQLSPARPSANVRIRNEGTQACRFLQATSVDRSLKLQSALAAGSLVAPGATVDLGVALASPSNFAPRSSTLQVRFDGSPDVAVPVTVTSTGLPSCLGVSPASLDFGARREDCAAPSKTVWISNLCTTPIEVSAVGLEGPFSLASSSSPMGGVLESGGAPLGLALRTTPNVPGNQGVLRVTTSAGEVAVPLQVQTQSAPIQTDTWGLRTTRRVDVLYVVDEGPAFGAAAPHVEAQWALSTQVLGLSFLARFGVVSTRSDGPHAGLMRRFDGGVWVESTSPAVQSLATLSDGGVGRRSCVEAAARALTPPNSTGWNAGFRRPNVTAVVVCATAGAEEATDPAWARSALLDAGIEVFQSLVPRTAQCGLPVVVDGGHEANAQVFGFAPVEDLCRTWSAGYWYSSSFGGFRTRYFLSQNVGSQRPIEVEVNGRPFPPGLPDGGVAWVLGGSPTVIDFTVPVEWSHPEVLQAPSTLVIRYGVACLP